MPTTPRKAIRKVLDDQVIAWNKGDLPGFMEGYWQSKDLRFYSGKDVTSGWQATLDRYRKRYQGEGKKMGQLTFSDPVRYSAPTPPWCVVAFRVLPEEKSAASSRSSAASCRRAGASSTITHREP